jgi:hypothetical protein
MRYRGSLSRYVETAKRPPFVAGPSGLRIQVPGMTYAPLDSMATRTSRDPWMQPSTADPWSDPPSPERRFFERRDSDPLRQSWTSDTELRDAERYATPTSSRRSAIARVIGVVGVLGVVGLAVVAFAPRMPVAASKLALLANRVELPWDPALQPGPAPIALDRGVTLAAAMDAAPRDATPLDPAPVVASRAESGAEPVTKATPEPATERSAAAMSTMPQPAPDTPHAAHDPADRSVSSSEIRTLESATESREPTLTPEEIERRKQRYEQWLESEGLERIR